MDHLKHPAGTLVIGLFLGVLVGSFMTKCEEKKRERDEFGVGAMVAEGIEKLDQMTVEVHDLTERVDDLETEVSVTDQSVEVVWELVNGLEDDVSLCCEE